jgi:hypothetical protein
MGWAKLWAQRTGRKLKGSLKTFADTANGGMPGKGSFSSARSRKERQIWGKKKGARIEIHPRF